MLRIRTVENGGRTVFVVSGRVDEQNIPELQQLLEPKTELGKITLDLDEVRLVDRDCVRFLAACEAGGVTLQHCPSFIRQWINTGSDKI